MNLRPLIYTAAVLFALPVAALELEVQSGSLASQLTDAVKNETSLTLTGTMDVRDFNALQDGLTALRELDLSGVEIEYYQPAPGHKVGFGGAAYYADELPQGALAGMKLTSLVLPASLHTIGPWALAGNDFATIKIPAGVSVIGDGAFQDCSSLTALTLPASVKSVGAYAFSRAPKLASIDMSAINLPVIPESLMMNDTALTDIKFPSGVTTIGNRAFYGCSSLKSLSFPATLTTIGTHSFASSGLESVSLPKSVTTVGNYAFALCPSLHEAVLANGSAELGQGIFFYCPEFMSFTAKGITEYPPYLFAGDASLVLPDNFTDVERIEAYALKDNRVDQLVLGSSLIYLGDGAFENMSALTNIDAMALEDRVPSLGEDVFEGIDTSSVRLLVAEGAGEPWKSAAQWKEFNIEEFSGLDNNLMPVDTGVKAWFDVRVLNISAPQIIDIVEVYNVNGQRVLALNPAGETAEVDASGLTERIYIVRVVLSDGSIATTKLTR